MGQVLKIQNVFEKFTNNNIKNHNPSDRGFKFYINE
jgi:hypothetical protein